MTTCLRSLLLLCVFAASASAQPTQYPGQVDLGDLLPGNGGDGSLGFVVEGLVTSTNLVPGAGDVNGDTYDDLLIGARQADQDANNEAGETYVVFGVSCDCGVGPPAVPLFSLWSQLALLGSMMVGGVWVASADGAQLRRRRARASPPP